VESNRAARICQWGAMRFMRGTQGNPGGNIQILRAGRANPAATSPC
jgi:hypothetical protein